MKKVKSVLSVVLMLSLMVFNVGVWDMPTVSAAPNYDWDAQRNLPDGSSKKVGFTSLEINELESRYNTLLSGKLDLLTLNDGTKVTSTQQWEALRRPELLYIMRQNEHGFAPESARGVEYGPEYADNLDITFDVVSQETITVNSKPVIRKKVNIIIQGPYDAYIDGSDRDKTDHDPVTIRLTLCIPASNPNPPVILYINNGSAGRANETSASSWPVDDMTSRGYAGAIFHYDDVAYDTSHGDSLSPWRYRNGVFAAFENYTYSTPLGQPAKVQERPPNAWGEVAAWAWGASRCMDYFEQLDSGVNSKQAAVVGVSRGGKTALWAGASDDRFAMTIGDSSGCNGAAIYHGKAVVSGALINGKQEGNCHIVKVKNNQSMWFSYNLIKDPAIGTTAQSARAYQDTMEFDQHMMLSLVAPRLLYIQSSANDNDGGNPPSEFLGAASVTPVYDLYNLSSLGVPATKESFNANVGSYFMGDGGPDALKTGRVGYHMREGLHSINRVDYNHFMNFADLHIAEVFAEPIAKSKSVAMDEIAPVDITLDYTEGNRPGPYTVSIVDQPSHGTLTGSYPHFTYTPGPTFTKTDSFTWKVNDGSADSNTAMVAITYYDGSNSAEFDSFNISAGKVKGVSIKNTAPVDVTGNLFVALYNDDGALVSVNVAQKTLERYFDWVLPLDIDIGDAKTIRAYFWNDLLSPLASDTLVYNVPSATEGLIDKQSLWMNTGKGISNVTIANEAFDVGVPLYNAGATVSSTALAEAVPDILKGGVLIRTDNLDNPTKAKYYPANLGTETAIKFTVTQAVTVYLAVPYSNTQGPNVDHSTLPAWMSSGGWAAVNAGDDTMQGNGASYKLYFKTYNAGAEVSLGCTFPPIGSKTPSTYVVIIKPQN
ncbi:MAG: hypothetical protein BWY15_01272 [Firmicutes bacterium ADurb.Bin193]|nr:MAG: hypothetical protein BWY15_01272 [Firmicutes bacterium ADurb.Bin193]